MSQRCAFGRLDLAITDPRPQSAAVAEADLPLRILILGDFSGRASRGEFETGAALAERRPIPVPGDPDPAIAALGVKIQLPAPQPADRPLEIGLASLDDFHVDRLVQRVEPLAGLCQLRCRLADPSAFPAVAAELRSWLAPHGLAAGGPQQVLACVDEALSTRLRSILHHPEFQAVESAWRGMQFLLSRLGGDRNVELWLLDMAKPELVADLDRDFRGSAIHRLLTERNADEPEPAAPWTILAGAYTFGAVEADIRLLHRLGQIASQLGVPFLASATSGIVGCSCLGRSPDPAQWHPPECAAWDTLRGSPEAAYLGLAFPRFLLRLPYGREGERTEALPFEELPDPANHECHLWGNPAFACICLLVQSLAEGGCCLADGDPLEIADLPLRVCHEAGRLHVHPCTEAPLDERAARLIRGRGLMALLPVPGRDAVRLDGFRSVAAGDAPLAGRWPGTPDDYC